MTTSTQGKYSSFAIVNEEDTEGEDSPSHGSCPRTDHGKKLALVAFCFVTLILGIVLCLSFGSHQAIKPPVQAAASEALRGHSPGTTKAEELVMAVAHNNTKDAKSPGSGETGNQVYPPLRPIGDEEKDKSDQKERPIGDKGNGWDEMPGDLEHVGNEAWESRDDVEYKNKNDQKQKRQSVGDERNAWDEMHVSATMQGDKGNGWDEIADELEHVGDKPGESRDDEAKQGGEDVENEKREELPEETKKRQYVDKWLKEQYGLEDEDVRGAALDTVMKKYKGSGKSGQEIVKALKGCGGKMRMLKEAVESGKDTSFFLDDDDDDYTTGRNETKDACEDSYTQSFEELLSMVNYSYLNDPKECIEPVEEYNDTNLSDFMYQQDAGPRAYLFYEPWCHSSAAFKEQYIKLARNVSKFVPEARFYAISMDAAVSLDVRKDEYMNETHPDSVRVFFNVTGVPDLYIMRRGPLVWMDRRAGRHVSSFLRSDHDTAWKDEDVMSRAVELTVQVFRRHPQEKPYYQYHPKHNEPVSGDSNNNAAAFVIELALKVLMFLFVLAYIIVREVRGDQSHHPLPKDDEISETLELRELS